MWKNILIMSLFLLVGEMAIAAEVGKKQQKILNMSESVLARLHAEKPSTKDEIANAAGYAVFSNIGVNLVLFSAGGGQGVVHNNETDENTYMNMGSAGLGIGLGVKDFRGVFVFHNRDALKNFIEYGWDFSGQADVAAKSGDKGEEASVATTAVNGVSLYQLTEAGLALQATLQGTKYWRSKKLN